MEVENMKKINMLQVCGHLGLGGIQKSLQIIAKYLDKNIFDISVCALMPGGVRERAIKKMGIKVYNVNKSPEKFVKKLAEATELKILNCHERSRAWVLGKSRKVFQR